MSSEIYFNADESAKCVKLSDKPFDVFQWKEEVGIIDENELLVMCLDVNAGKNKKEEKMQATFIALAKV